jgi:hypothetical protein
MVSYRKLKKTSVLFVKNPENHQKSRSFHGLIQGLGSIIFFIAFRLDSISQKDSVPGENDQNGQF